MKRSAITWLALLLAVLLAGCSGGTETVEKPTICVVLKAMDSVHWMSVQDGLEQAAQDYNVSVNILWPSDENDVDAQNTILRDVIASRPDAIAVSPCDSEQVDVLEQAEDRIPCFYIDTRSEQFDFPYIGADNKNIGRLAARALAQEVQTGQIAVIMGNSRQSTHAERLQGFTEELKQYPALELCAVRESETSSYLESMKCMEEILREYPEVKGVFCTSALMVLGAMEEQDKAGADVRLVGVDMQSDAMSGVEDGRILALVGQNGYEIGYQTIRTMVRYLNGEDIEHDVHVETPLITQDNAAEYLEKYLTERGEGND